MQAGWMVLAAFFFATMGVCVKAGSEYFNAAELVCYRGFISMAVLWCIARSRGITLRTAYPRMHFVRSLIGVTSMGAWFYAIGVLPLATALTLNYMGSIWIAAFIVGGALLAWRPSSGTAPQMQLPLVLVILAGFGGVILILRPAIGPNQMFAGMVGLLSGFLSAFAYMQVMALSRIGEPETRTVFFFALGSAVAGALAMPLAGLSPWSWRGALWLPPIGLFAALGQLCMTRAYSSAGSHRGTLTVASLQYTGIVFGALYGMLVFGDTIPPIAWAGMVLVIASGVAATVLRSRAAPGTPPEAEEH